MESGNGAVRVFLVDDHEVVRRGVAEVLEEDPVISVVGEAGSVAEALARVPAVRPDVTVVDMRLPDRLIVQLSEDAAKAREHAEFVVQAPATEVNDAKYKREAEALLKKVQ